MARPKGKTPTPQVLDRERLVTALRRKGHTWEEIAEKAGYKSPSGASEAYLRASSRVVVEDVQIIRKLENDRLDLLFNAVWDQALAGDTKAVEICLKVMTRRARLLGLDSPPEHRVTVHETWTREEVDAGVQDILRAFDKAKELGIDLND
jgi:hypothetical protein